MAAGTLASLLIDLTVNSAGLREGLDSAKKTVSEFGKTITKTLEGVEQMGKSIKRAANEVAQAGLGLAAVASGAVALAATVDKGIAAEVKNLKTAFQDLAVPIAQMVVPAMRELASWIRTAADFVAGLSPHTKQMIATFIQVAAVVGGAALVISKVAAAVGALAGVLAAITAGPFLAVVAGMAVIAAGALFLHKVWRENWGGIQEWTREVVTTITEYWAAFKTWFGTFLDGVIDKWATVEKAIARVGNAIKAMTPGSGFGLDDLAKMNRRTDAQIDQWAESMKGGGLGQAVLDLGRKIKDGFVDAAGALKAELDIILDGFDLKLGKAARHGVASEKGTPTQDAIFAMTSSSLAAAKEATEIANQRIAEEGQRMADTIAARTDAIMEMASSATRASQEASEIRDRMIREEGQRTAAVFEKIGYALQNAAATVLQSMGDVGKIATSAIQGAQTAGPWGAVIAVIGELLSRLEVFTKFSDMLNQKLFKSLGELNTAIAPLFVVFTQLSEALNPVREIIHSVIRFVLGVLQPIFNLVGGLLKGLGAVLEPISNSLGALFEVISTIVNLLSGMTPVMESLRIVFALVGAAINFAALGIMGTASNLLSTVRDIMKALGLNTDAVTKTLNEITLKAVMMAAKQKEFDLFAAPPLPKATANIESLGEAAAKTAETFEQMNLNLPEGYKINNARFGADGAIGGPAAGVAVGVGTGTSFDFSSVSFDVGELVTDAIIGAFTAEGTLTGQGSTDLGGSGGTFVPGSGDGWTQQQMIAFMNAFQAALDAGATEEQATQAGTMAANSVGQGGGGGGGGAGGGGGGGGGGGEEASSGGVAGGVHFYGPVNLAPANFEEFIGKIGEAETRSSSRKRRNPSRAK